MNNSSTIIFEDPMLGNNEILVKSICLMWYFEAYDLIFIPHQEKIDVKIKLPINNSFSFNEKNPIAQISHEKFDYLKMAIKLAGNLSIINNEIPQTSSFQIKVDNEKFAIRCSFHPTNFGEGLCLRIIKSSIFQNLENISHKIDKGLNIIGGRTCSGKTTLMYSSISKFSGHVITLEDPVEFFLENICQTDVSILGYEEGIKSALRQNPDLICIGEIRDKISAKSAIKAALTGHSVLATIHITSPFHLISRLKDFDCDFFDAVLSKIFFVENFQYEEFVFHEGKIEKIV
jgi:type II secretory ATPase GspE/PulE/Tfp pilus assembly ATPase PilB-like protein